MLDADNRPVGVVIKRDEFFAPPDDNRKARIQTSGNCGLEGLRPGFDRTQGRARPVERARQLAHRAPTRKDAIGSNGADRHTRTMYPNVSCAPWHGMRPRLLTVMRITFQPTLLPTQDI